MRTPIVPNSALVAAFSLAAAALWVAPADACGGFFCSQAQPVNQAAERIIFANNGDGTVTAVIQIMYQGPSENFSWLLPISSMPEGDDIAVASDLAFQRLQQATNPQYSLTTRTEGTCRADQNQSLSGGMAGNLSAPSASPDFAAEGGPGGVTVAASGVVGAFEWTALELDPELEDPAGAALTWLTDNGYDVLPSSAELIGPYLESGMYLLALKLTKGSSTGSIRPIVLTYEGTQPSIPIKLTAVAANADMGVMTWMLSDDRAVPFNYNALELNEARINWFNASSNYNDVVTAAANDSGGQGFVTEFAAASTSLANVVWRDFEEQDWQSIRAQVYSSFGELFNTTYNQYGSFDGFWDTVRDTVTLPDNLPFSDFQTCPDCYSNQVSLSPTAYLNALEAGVIQPMRRVQQLIDAQPYVTRLYSTLSPADMTIDPVFTFNPDLDTVSNIHSAERIIECNSNIYSWQAPWRIEFPQGSVIRGTANDFGNWPQAVNDQPANLRVSTLSDSGPGLIAEDNLDKINSMLATYNARVPEPVPTTDPFMPGVIDNPRMDPQSPDPMLPSLGGPSGMAEGSGMGIRSSSGGCAVAGGSGRGRAGSFTALLALMGYGLIRRRRAGLI